MAEAGRDEVLREMAANRGCKLVKSRRRKPGVGDYGRYGLADAATGRKVFGFGPKGLTASPEEIEAFLRKGMAATWRTSLGGGGKVPKRREAPRKSRPHPPKSEAKRERKPEPEPEPQPEPELRIREAKARDAAALAALISEAAEPVSEAELRARLKRLIQSGEPPLLAELDAPVGCLAWHVVEGLHQAEPTGRISLLATAPEARRQGVAWALVEAAEARLAARGCAVVEASAAIDFAGASAFFRRIGFERSAYLFTKALQE